MSRAVTILAVLMALALAGPIACGKRGQLEAPPDEPSTWPRAYPTT